MNLVDRPAGSWSQCIPRRAESDAGDELCRLVKIGRVRLAFTPDPFAAVADEENSSRSGGLETKPGDWRRLADRNPGGMVFPCGFHALRALNHPFGLVTAVQAMLRDEANSNTRTAMGTRVFHLGE